VLTRPEQRLECKLKQSFRGLFWSYSPPGISSSQRFVQIFKATDRKLLIVYNISVHRKDSEILVQSFCEIYSSLKIGKSTYDDKEDFLNVHFKKELKNNGQAFIS
jgi:hypothetical protein